MNKDPKWLATICIRVAEGCLFGVISVGPTSSNGFITQRLNRSLGSIIEEDPNGIPRQPVAQAPKNMPNLAFIERVTQSMRRNTRSVKEPAEASSVMKEARLSRNAGCGRVSRLWHQHREKREAYDAVSFRSGFGFISSFWFEVQIRGRGTSNIINTLTIH